MRLIYCVLGMFFYSAISFGQNPPVVRCATMNVLERKLKQDPTFARRIEEKRAKVASRFSPFSLNKMHTDTSEIVIPVVVHVVYQNSIENISDAQINSQINIINDDYRRNNADSINTPAPFVPVAGRMKIKFQLANQDPFGNPTSGITRTHSTRTVGFYDDDSVKFTSTRGIDAWDTKHYMNLWVCKMSGNLLGYGQFADDPDSLTDGVVINYECFGDIGTVKPPYDKGRTLTHELGHWLQLYHTWGDNYCGNDYVDDTPTQQTSTFGCSVFPHYSCGNDITGLMSGDMFMNYMDYSDDNCMNIFTKGQIDRMMTFFNLYRYKIRESNGLGIKESFENDAVSIYPNPSVDGKFTIQLPLNASLSECRVLIRNTLGAVVFDQTYGMSDQKTIEINAHQLSSGLYILQLLKGKALLVNKKILLN